MYCLALGVDPMCSCLQVKCDQYWPVRGTETYGMIQVTMLDTVELATYSVRTFALYKVGHTHKGFVGRLPCFTAYVKFLQKCVKYQD